MMPDALAVALNVLQDTQVRSAKLHAALTQLVEELERIIPNNSLRDSQAFQRAKNVLSELRESGAV
jgi:CRISPR/Cas system CMR-associated protein Cmr5 small subunit